MFEQKISLAKMTAAVLAAVVVAGSLFAVSTSRAHAVTLGELVELFIALDIISGDKADEARAVLDNQGGSTSGGSMSGLACADFTRNLKQGDTGGDVMELQQFLNSIDGIQVAVSGAGSPGMETMYFGPATAAAVTAFQNMYAADVLTPLGLSAGTGFFGASSRSKAADLCAGGGTPTVPDLPDLPDMGDDDDDMGDDDDDMSSREASLEDYDALNNPSDEELSEGDEDEAVFGFEFDVEDGDVSVRRIDVHFQGTSNSNCNGSAAICEDEPWNSLDAVSLWVDGEKVAEEAADDEDDWEEPTSGVYRMRFTGLNERFDDGDTAEFLVGVTVSNGIDDSDLNQTWTVWVPANGLRALDGAGIDQYTGSDSASNKETFDIESASADQELKISTASDNPDESTIQVDTTSDTDGVEVFVFDIESEEADTEVNKIVIFATSSHDDLEDVISDLVLEIDGMTLDDWYWGNTASATSAETPTFSAYAIFDLNANDDEFTIDADEEVTARLLVDFQDTNNGSRYANGVTIEFDVNAVARENWEADDADGDEMNENSGSATISGTGDGEQHQLIAEGIFADNAVTDVDVDQGDNSANDSAVFEIQFEVTAYEEDFYISTTSSAFDYSVQLDGATISTTTSASISSTADEINPVGNFIVREGQTETFTLQVSFNPSGTSGFYRIQMTNINYSAGNDTTYELDYTPTPTNDFRTAQVDLDA